MGGVRLVDPLEQQLLDQSFIEDLFVDDLRNLTPAVFAQLDRLSRLPDRIYVHIDMDVLDRQRSWDMGIRYRMVLRAVNWQSCLRQSSGAIQRHPPSALRAFPNQDEGGLSLSAVNTMTAGAIRGLYRRSAGQSR